MPVLRGSGHGTRALLAAALQSRAGAWGVFTMMTKILAAAALALAATAARAECKLSQLASLDVTMIGDAPHVPLSLAGEKGLMQLSFLASVSMINEDVAERHRLKRESIDRRLWLAIAGRELRQLASVPLELGATSGTLKMAILPVPSANPNVFGQLGLDVLNRFDVELDFGHGKVNLFSPDHCKGQVVYWTHSAPVATAAIELHNQYQFTVPMLLDGKTVRAQFSAFGEGTIDGEIAQRQFGVGQDESSHVFKTLGFEGLAIANPRLSMRRSSACDEFKGPSSYCHGDPEMTLGIPELRRLRLFMAFSERKLYVTAAGAS